MKTKRLRAAARKWYYRARVYLSILHDEKDPEEAARYLARFRKQEKMNVNT